MVVAAIRTVAAILTVALYVLVCGPIALLWTAVTGRANLMYLLGYGGVRIGFALAGLRLRVRGIEHLSRTGVAVYAGNHSSNVDPPAVYLALRPLFPKVRVLYKAELRKLPILVWVFDAAGFVPLERANPDQSWPAIDRAADALRAGNSFFIFPEGTRSRTGELLPFKKGGFVMAIKAQAPVVPIAVTGGRDAMHKGSRLIWPATVTVEFCAPVPTTGMGLDDRDVLVSRVRESLAEKLT